MTNNTSGEINDIYFDIKKFLRFFQRRYISFAITLLIFLIIASFYCYIRPVVYKQSVFVKSERLKCENKNINLLSQNELKRMIDNFYEIYSKRTLSENNKTIHSPEKIEVSLLKNEGDDRLKQLNIYTKDTIGIKNIIKEYAEYLNNNYEKFTKIDIYTKDTADIKFIINDLKIYLNSNNYLNSQLKPEKEKLENLKKIIDDRLKDMKFEIDNYKQSRNTTGKYEPLKYNIFNDYEKLQEKKVETEYNLSVLNNIYTVNSETPVIRTGLSTGKIFVLALILGIIAGIFIAILKDNLQQNNY